MKLQYTPEGYNVRMWNVSALGATVELAITRWYIRFKQGLID